jgi:hypothetical protein
MLSRGTEDCEVCKIVRWYLMIGVPLVILFFRCLRIRVVRLGPRRKRC